MISSILLLFGIFFKIGAFSFGGGLAMLPIIFQTISDYGFMTAGEFANLVAISQVTPGPVVVNAATYVGFQLYGLWGAFAATLGVSIPALVVTILAAKFLDKFKTNRIVVGLTAGIKPATIGLIAAGLIFLGKEIPIAVAPIMIFAVTIFLSGKLKVNPILITMIMAITGALIC